MKLFKVFREKITFVIDRQNHSTLAAYFNPRILPPILTYSCCGILLSISIVVEHHTLEEFCELFYAWITTVLNLCGLLIAVVYRKEMFQLIDLLGDLVGDRKFISRTLPQ